VRAVISLQISTEVYQLQAEQTHYGLRFLDRGTEQCVVYCTVYCLLKSVLSTELCVIY